MKGQGRAVKRAVAASDPFTRISTSVTPSLHHAPASSHARNSQRNFGGQKKAAFALFLINSV
jgi:hypothetical protein